MSILETRLAVQFSSSAWNQSRDADVRRRAYTGGRGVEEEEEGPRARVQCQTTWQTVQEGSGNGGKRGTVRHVKLTNRSGLAGFRIPRVIGRDPVARSGTMVSPRSTARPRSVREGTARARQATPLPRTPDAHPHILALPILAEESGFRQYLPRVRFQGSPSNSDDTREGVGWCDF